MVEKDDPVGQVIAEDEAERASECPSNASYFVTSEAMQTCNELRQQLADVTAERDEARARCAELESGLRIIAVSAKGSPLGGLKMIAKQSLNRAAALNKSAEVQP